MFFIRRVSGNSMTPTLKSGQVVLCKKNEIFKNGQIVVAKVKNIEVIKRIGKIENDNIFLVVDDNKHAHNGEYYAEINKNKVVGLVIWPKVSVK
jgi:phage repressor protein C with HTH and peptisase S24 domain